LNVNVGILGHVDSGKTSLSKALSTHASTCAFDKHPQSKERGITLDLGFSAFFRNPPENIAKKGYDRIQYTLVDCPGHASLIKTIIGGAQIIDVMILVIDITKGIQTQTAECIVIGEITTANMIIALNKIDQLPEEGREKRIEKVKKNLAAVFNKTKFKNAPMIPVAAAPGGKDSNEKLGLQELINELEKHILLPEQKIKQNEGNSFLMAVDHCFAIKGVGTVLTGTILQGTLSVNQTIEIPIIKEQRKVKSIQMFKQPVESASKGDRVGVCVTQLDTNRFERAFVAEPGTVKIVKSFIATVEKIRFYKKPVKSKSKFHITVGHSTVMGDIRFLVSHTKDENVKSFDLSKDYHAADELLLPKDVEGTQYIMVELESEITCPDYSKFIGSRLETDIHSNTCRLAFYGTVLPPIDFTKIKAFKSKEKTANVDRIVDDYTLIGKNILKKGGDLTLYIGKKIELEYKNKIYHGTIDSAFGKSGKFKASFQEKLPSIETMKDAILRLKYRINVFDKNRTWIQ